MFARKIKVDCFYLHLQSVELIELENICWIVTEEYVSIDIVSKCLLLQYHQWLAVCPDYGFAFSVIDLDSFEMRSVCSISPCLSLLSSGVSAGPCGAPHHSGDGGGSHQKAQGLYHHHGDQPPPH